MMTAQEPDEPKKQVCPRCKDDLVHPTLSKHDASTWVCMDCGINEMMWALINGKRAQVPGFDEPLDLPVNAKDHPAQWWGDQ